MHIIEETQGKKGPWQLPFIIGKIRCFEVKKGSLKDYNKYSELPKKLKFLFKNIKKEAR